MKTIKSENHRKALIENVVRSVVERCIYESLDDFENALKEQLKSDLNFKTTILEFGIEDENRFFGKIQFCCDNDETEVLSFSIASSSYMKKCKVCGEGTEVIFNIKFKPVPICENCAKSIFLQQAKWYVEI